MMDAQIHLMLSIVGAVAVLWGAGLYWTIRRQRLQRHEDLHPSSKTHGPWLPKNIEENTCLLHEERYFLKPEPGKKGAHRVLREERYYGRLSGAVIASLPPRPIAKVRSLSEGRELLAFLGEVSSGGQRAA